MNFQRLHDISLSAWLKFLRALNGIVMAVLPAVVLIHQAYPSVVAGAVSKLPPWAGIAAIFGFCLLVHYALRRSIKANG